MSWGRGSSSMRLVFEAPANFIEDFIVDHIEPFSDDREDWGHQEHWHHPVDLL